MTPPETSRSLFQIWLQKINWLSDIKKPAQLLKILFGYMVIAAIGFLPLIIALIGASIEHALTGKKINEGNSIFGVLPWLCLFTLPVAFLIGIIWTVIAIRRIYIFFKRDIHG